MKHANTTYLNIKTLQPFPRIGSYFKLITYIHQPTWCSYSLMDLIPAWEETGGWIENENGDRVRFKMHVRETLNMTTPNIFVLRDNKFEKL